MRTHLLTLALSCLLISASALANGDMVQGTSVNDKTFPWQLVVDRGKILGCVYDNKFYSLGAILILESLPRKCELGSDRNGLWEQLSEAEMQLFSESLQKQQALERESTYIGSDPVNPDEARVIRYLRGAKQKADGN